MQQATSENKNIETKSRKSEREREWETQLKHVIIAGK